MRCVLLGSGGSDGVPRIGGEDGGGDWGECDPANPRNRRTRTSLFVEDDDGLGILIDSSPDLRSQLLDNRINKVDCVIYTHDHADHSHGIHELRRLGGLSGNRPIVYGDEVTMRALAQRFAYAFNPEPESPYEPIVVPRVVNLDGEFALANGRRILSYAQDHGFGAKTMGIRMGDVAYSTDVTDLPEAAFAKLENLKLWFIDCVRYTPHPTHSHFEGTLDWISRVRPDRAILIHMNQDLDYDELLARCPEGVEPGYDGLTIHV